MRPWGSKPRLLTKNQSLRAPQVQYKRPQLDSKSTSHVLLTYPKLQSKTPFNQSTISQFRNLGVEIWIQGNLLSLPYNLSQFPLLGDYGSKFQTYYVFMVFCTFVISNLQGEIWAVFTFSTLVAKRPQQYLICKNDVNLVAIKKLNCYF